MDIIRISENTDNGNKYIEMLLSVYSFKEDNSYITYCPSLDLSSYGTTESHARKSFRDVLEMTIEHMIDNNTLAKDFERHGWKTREMDSPRFNPSNYCSDTRESGT
ncbi:MAG: hypothetical protein LBE56_01245 [Tannerella sp.]|jgi:predicted RNase H-like HicB family nuclease|nr:hypothetical protein [Tannerella sp.]